MNPRKKKNKKFLKKTCEFTKIKLSKRDFKKCFNAIPYLINSNQRPNEEKKKQCNYALFCAVSTNLKFDS